MQTALTPKPRQLTWAARQKRGTLWNLSKGSVSEILTIIYLEDQDYLHNMDTLCIENNTHVD